MDSQPLSMRVYGTVRAACSIAKMVIPTKKKVTGNEGIEVAAVVDGKAKRSCGLQEEAN